jgi:intracellular septation protein A
MPITVLLKQMLPGLLPLFVFIAVDEIYGIEAGLYAALGFGLMEMIFTWLRERRIDRFVLFDTGFLVLLGGVSLLLKDAIFFKLKPAAIELVICVFLGVAAARPEMFLKAMTGRYMKNMELNVTKEGINAMRRMMLFLTVIFFLHTALTVYAAFFMSERAWGFISGVLFYIIFGVIFAGQMIALKIRKKKNAM